MWQVWGREEMRYGDEPEGKSYMQDLGVDGRIISTWLVKEQEWEGAD
jgi:hypothetical protein